MADNSGAVMARKGPYVMAMKPGKYWWCACGRSANQPFCDGAHKQAAGLGPLETEIKEEREVAWCGCKHSAGKPFCDGAHKKL